MEPPQSNPFWQRINAADMNVVGFGGDPVWKRWLPIDNKVLGSPQFTAVIELRDMFGEIKKCVVRSLWRILV